MEIPRRRLLNEYVPKGDVLILSSEEAGNTIYSQERAVPEIVRKAHKKFREASMTPPPRIYVPPERCDPEVRPDIYEEFANLQGYWGAEPGTEEDLGVQNEPWNPPEVQRFQSDNRIRIVDEKQVSFGFGGRILDDVLE